MGRRRGKGKKQTVVAARDDPVNSEEEKLPASKRRGRPQKPLKDEGEDEKKTERIDDDENAKSPITSKDSTDNGRKRKRSTQVKENSDSGKEESGSGAKHSNDTSKELTESVGFRLNGHRRKSKPRRAAEVGVECN